MSTGLRAAVFRAGWGLTDQSLSSLTNFAMGILAARELGPEAFGVFSVAFATYNLAQGASRSISSEPFVVRYSHVPDDDPGPAMSRAAGAALAAGALGAVGCLAASFLLHNELQDAFVALAIVLPGLMLQDYWRFSFFARGHGKAAFLNDLVWAAVLFPSLAFLMANGLASPRSFILIWGVSGLVAAIAGLAQTRVVPRPHEFPTWLREQRDLAPRFAGEFVGSSGLLQIALYLIGAIAGLATLGILRAAVMLLGPLTILFQGIRLFAVPEGVKTARAGVGRLLGFALVIGAALFVGAIGWGIAIMLISQDFGVWLLKDSWEPAREIVLILAVSTAGSGATSGAAVGLRATAAASRSLRATWLSGLLIVFGSTAGTFLGGVRGAAIGIAVATWLSTVIWWREFLRELKDPSKPGSGGLSPIGPVT